MVLGASTVYMSYKYHTKCTNETILKYTTHVWDFMRSNLLKLELKIAIPALGQCFYFILRKSGCRLYGRSK